MKAIILAAGRGTRMGALTDNCPKPMLKVKGKNLLEWKLDALPAEVDEVIFVVGYLKEVIMNYFKDTYENESARKINIQYIEQTVLDGSAGAVMLCRDLIKNSGDEKFLVLMGDDIYNEKDLRILADQNCALLGMPVDNKYGGGKIVTDVNNKVLGLDEGLSKFEREEGVHYKEYANTGAYVLPASFFDCTMIKVKENEYGLPHTILSAENKKLLPEIHLSEGTFWIQITSPESIVEAEGLLS
jgi:NDP-sugar pyrophosphorylase family protein